MGSRGLEPQTYPLQTLLAVHGGDMCILAMDRDGHPFSITSEPEGERYLVMTDLSKAPEFREEARFSIYGVL